MSEPIPESIPTSQDPRSKRPLKRRALTPVTQQAAQVDALFAKPDRDIPIPSGSAAAVAKKPGGGLAPPPEIVANVQGSSAGAGSGEFHVYKASRRREYERVKMMDEEVASEKADEDFERKRVELRKRDEEKTLKNRRRREKARKKNKKGGLDEGREGGLKSESDKKTGGAERPEEDSAVDDEADAGPLPAPVVEDVGVIIHDED